MSKPESPRPTAWRHWALASLLALSMSACLDPGDAAPETTEPPTPSSGLSCAP